MKKVIIIIIVLAIFFSFILLSHNEIQQNIFPKVTMQNADSIFSMIRNYVNQEYKKVLTNFEKLTYFLLNTVYIRNHPGQALLLYPWNPSTSIKVLPYNFEVLAAPANNLSITASRNQFEAASFIITAQKNVSGIGIDVPDLYDTQGNRIPAGAINVRLVKVWYQAAEGTIWFDTPGKVLAPELLLKDDTLVKVDYINKTNYLKVTINGSEQYIDISNPAGTFPSNAQIHDAQSLQPFSLQANENKQIWVTVHVPDNLPAGEYSGEISITTPSEAPVMMNLQVTVLPFDLEPAPVEYSIFYFGLLPYLTSEKQKVGIDGVWKSPEKYAAELQNMKDHGIEYPTFYQWYSSEVPDGPANLALALRSQTGFPTDKIYLLDLTTGNSTSITDLTDLKNNVRMWKNFTSQYGYQDVYIYGMDEAEGEVLRSERPAWQAVHDSGGKIYSAVSGDYNAVTIVGDILDVAIFAYDFNTTQVAAWQSNKKRIFSYANPESGVENPAIFRQNYGFALWNAGYDGEMIYAYQSGFGQSIWNDFDDPHWRDHVFAYPTSDGVIDTIQWEGFREGVDDTHYVASLIKHEGNDTTARAIVTDSLSRKENMATLREKIIHQILISQPPEP